MPLSQSMESDRAFVAETEAQILELATQISALERSVSLLRKTQQAAKTRLDSYTYPVLTLPLEIISEIFLHYLPPYPTPPPLTGSLSPIRLTHICRQWREMVIATPVFWRAIDLSDRPIRLKDVASLAALWLGRTGGCSLSIDAIDWKPITSALIPHRSRWEHMRLHRLQDWPRIFEESFPTPLLQTLLLLPTSPTSLPIPREIPLALIDVPCLRTVELSMPGGPYPSLPWQQLTSLNFRSIFLPDCVHILRQTPSLITLRCYIRYKHEDSPPPSGIALLQLNSLYFSCDFVHRHESYLNLFIVPALRVLDVSEAVLSTTPIPALQTFITTSSCTLKKLRISEAEGSRKTYEQAFPDIPDITVIPGDESN
ncbi:F-box domain-containing protein [Favolaschia claudopus]|uniref:F-box domain-containing protein n=1 Tax=Favolaschia claudopus TaxID=2862362 RepID=A0AAW0AM77_9AGAR